MAMSITEAADRLATRWARAWMQYASLTSFGRIATCLATWAPLPYLAYYEQQGMAKLAEFGYVAPSVLVQHDNLHLGRQVFISDHVRLVRDQHGGPITLGDHVWLGSGCRLYTGERGAISIGHLTSIGCECGLAAYLSAIHIGNNVMIGSSCHFFPYNHGMAPDIGMQRQPLSTKGDIVVEDDVWIGTGAIVLSGVIMGRGAVVGAGAVVTRSIPPGAIVAGNPARIISYRADHQGSKLSSLELVSQAPQAVSYLPAI
jgi:acetyltransferase-like isoleucine patch superfamily enzyme